MDVHEDCVDVRSHNFSVTQTVPVTVCFFQLNTK